MKKIKKYLNKKKKKMVIENEKDEKRKNIKNSENKFNKKDITQYKKLINNYSIYRYINILFYSFYIIFFISI